MDSTQACTENRPTLLPEGFLFGVSDSGYQSEGGFNGPGQPANNWADWERQGKAEPAGIANEFWTRYEEHFARAAGAGCDTYRLGIEWTRCEPAPGVIDIDALEHYAKILESCRNHGLEPVVALHHFTQPAWLGTDFWLQDSAPERFAAWTRLAVSYLASLCSRWITINEINAVAIGGYFIGYFPPGHLLRPASMGKALDHMLTAHVLAYEVIHELQSEAKVGMSTYAFWYYGADAMLTDVLRARVLNVSRDDLPAWFASRRKMFHRRVLAGLSAPQALEEAAINVVCATLLPDHTALSRTIEAVFSSPHEQCLDVVQVSYYDPQLSNYVKLPGRINAGKRSWRPDPKHWEQTPSPEHMATYLAAKHELGDEIWILENGLCNPVIDGISHPRPDGRERPEYLRQHLSAVVDAIESGVNVTSYYNWGIFDNYQWGDFESCFGLYGVNRDNGCTFLETDSMGIDSGAAFRELITGLRTNDRAVIDEPTARPASAHRSPL